MDRAQTQNDRKLVSERGKDVSPNICERCNDSGTIAVSVYFPMSYRGPGPVPEDARGVTDRACDVCGGR